MANTPITRYVSKFTGPAIDAAIEKMSGIGNITGADINKAVTIINSGINNNNKILFGDAETTTKWIDIGTGLEIQNNTLVVTGGGSSTDTWRPVQVNGTTFLDNHPNLSRRLWLNSGITTSMIADNDSYEIKVEQKESPLIWLSNINSTSFDSNGSTAQQVAFFILKNGFDFYMRLEEDPSMVPVKMRCLENAQGTSIYQGKNATKVYTTTVDYSDHALLILTATPVVESVEPSTISTATSTVAGIIKLGDDTPQTSSDKVYPVQLNASQQAVVKVPWSSSGTDTWRPVSVDGTQEIGSGTDTGNLKLVSGSGISITVDNNDNITIANTGSTAYSAGTGISISSNEISIANLPAAQNLSSSSATTVTDQTLIKRITAGLPFVADIDNLQQIDDCTVVMYKTGNEELTKPVYKGQRNGVTYSTTITQTGLSSISFSQVTTSSGGQAYSAGPGIDITSNTISVEDMPVFTWTGSSDISISDQSVLDHIAKGLPIKVQLNGSSSPYMILYNTYTEYKSSVTVYTYTSKHIEMDNDLSIARFEDEYSTTVRIPDSGTKKISKPTLVTGYLDLTSISSIDVSTVIGTTGELAIVDGLIFDAEACSAIIDNAETYHLPIKCLYTYTGTVANNKTSYPMLQYQGKYYHDYSGLNMGDEYDFSFNADMNDTSFEILIAKKWDSTSSTYKYYLTYTVGPSSNNYVDLSDISILDFGADGWDIGSTGELILEAGAVFTQEQCDRIIDNAEIFQAPFKCPYGYNKLASEPSTSYPELIYQGKFHRQNGYVVPNQYEYIFECKLKQYTFQLIIWHKYLQSSSNYVYSLRYQVWKDVIDGSSPLDLSDKTSSSPVTFSVVPSTESSILRKQLILNVTEGWFCDVRAKANSNSSANSFSPVLHYQGEHLVGDARTYEFSAIVSDMPNSSTIYRYTLNIQKSSGVTPDTYQVTFWGMTL